MPRKAGPPAIVHPGSLVLLAGLVVLGLIPFGPTSPVSPPLAHSVPFAGSTVRNLGSPVIRTTPTVYWSHPTRPNSTGDPAPGSPGPVSPGSVTLGPARPTLVLRSASVRNCPLDVGYNVNFSLALTPSNGSGAAPFTVGYSVTTYGGFPPYIIEGAFTRSAEAGMHDWSDINTDGNLSYSGQLRGNVTIPEAGIFEFYFSDTDSVCNGGSIYGDVTAWGASGPNPVSLHATNLTGPAPLRDTFTVGAIGPPANSSIVWYSSSEFPDDAVMTAQSSRNITFLQNGSWGFFACILRGSDESFWGCSPWLNVTVTGPSTFSVQSTPTVGTSPLLVTVWLNVTDPSALPTTNWSMQADSVWTYGPGTVPSAEYNETYDCGEGQGLPLLGPGHPYCTGWSFEFTFYGGPGNDSALGLLDIAVAPIPGTVPSFNISLSPLGGPGPLTVDLNLSATNATQPKFNYSILGKTSLTPSGTWLSNRFSPQNASWGGGNLTVPLWLNASAYYWIQGAVWEGQAISCFFDAPLFQVAPNASVGPSFLDDHCVYTPPSGGAGNGSGGGGGSSGNGSGNGTGGHGGGGNSSGSGNGSGNGSGKVDHPLGETSTASNATGPAIAGLLEHFWTNATGGTAPYTLTWRFGDGATSTSESASGEFQAVHTYASAGEFVPWVTIVDANGTGFTAHLDPVVVTPGDLAWGTPGTTSPPPTPLAGSPSPALSTASIVVLVVVVAVALLALALRGGRGGPGANDGPGSNPSEEAASDPVA